MPRRRRIRPRGQMVTGFKDVISQPLWDTQAFANGNIGQKVYFQEQVGVSSKTLWDTYLKQQGEIARGQQFVLHGFSLGVLDPEIVSADYLSIMVTAKSTFTFTLVDKIYFEAPLYFIPPFNFVYSLDAQTASDYATPFNNVPYLKLAKPIVILGKQNFNVTVNINSAIAVTKTYNIAVFMHGILKRSVQ